MTGQRCWTEMQGDEGRPVPGCWVTPEGYIVSLCRLTKTPFTVIRPGDRAPFAYLGDEAEVVRMIQADRQARAEEGVCA